MIFKAALNVGFALAPVALNTVCVLHGLCVTSGGGLAKKANFVPETPTVRRRFATVRREPVDF